MCSQNIIIIKSKKVSLVKSEHWFLYFSFGKCHGKFKRVWGIINIFCVLYVFYHKYYKLMSQNPIDKIPLPANPDPRTISVSEFSRYQSHEINRFHASLRSYKRSLIYIGGTLALSAVFFLWGSNAAKRDLFGDDSNIQIMQTEAEATWTWRPSTTRTTWLTTESSRECTFWARANWLILLSTVFTWSRTWEVRFLNHSIPTLLRKLPMRNSIDGYVKLKYSMDNTS